MKIGDIAKQVDEILKDLMLWASRSTTKSALLEMRKQDPHTFNKLVPIQTLLDLTPSSTASIVSTYQESVKAQYDSLLGDDKSDFLHGLGASLSTLQAFTGPHYGSDSTKLMLSTHRLISDSPDYLSKGDSGVTLRALLLEWYFLPAWSIISIMKSSGGRWSPSDMQTLETLGGVKKRLAFLVRTLKTRVLKKDSLEEYLNRFDNVDISKLDLAVTRITREVK